MTQDMHEFLLREADKYEESARVFRQLAGADASNSHDALAMTAYQQGLSIDNLVAALREIATRLDSAAAEVDCFNVCEARDLAHAAIAKSGK